MGNNFSARVGLVLFLAAEEEQSAGLEAICRQTAFTHSPWLGRAPSSIQASSQRFIVFFSRQFGYDSHSCPH